MGVQGNWEKRRFGTLEGLGAIDRRKFLALSGMSAAALVLGGGPLSEKTMARPSATTLSRSAWPPVTHCPTGW